MLTGRIRLSILILLIIFSCSRADSQKLNIQEKQKINGLSFVAPSKAIDSSWTKLVKETNAGWIAIIPYAFSEINKPQVFYNAERQYWGESIEGVKTNIRQAHAAGLKVMVKPQVWVRGSWIGDFDLQSEADWLIWESQYEKYILTFAQLANDEKADMICIGTELKIAIKKRPDFWLKMINNIRKIYQGKLTYCANWDDYKDVNLWKSLDYVGISAYFPLSEGREPDVKELMKAWKPIKKQLAEFSKQITCPVLFTEYGYRSMDKPAWRSWELENQRQTINEKGQANAYEALFETFWKEDWFAGGFAWKWYSSFRRMDPENNDDWTPQNKQAQDVISRYYK